MQSWEWGKARISLGTPLLRYGLYNQGKLQKAFQLTFHKIPFSSQFVGYLPKGPLPDKELYEALEIIGKEQNCAFIKLEPDILEDETKPFRIYPKFLPSPKPLFTKHNFILDLTQSEDEILKKMHPKTRYNLRVAQKKGVEVKESTSDEAFKIYLKLYFETTQRQNYHGHNPNYHKKIWEALKKDNMATILIAYYKKTPLTAWMLLNFKDKLYYPYGGSSLEHKGIMANNLVAWEAIKLGKKLGLKEFDMWGALGPNADPKDPWYGFHRFKQGYGGKLVEYIGTYDLVFNNAVYWTFTSIDKLTPLKVFLLKVLGK
ncbi:MAG: femAB family protein [uncultured bacterium]|nr:MAG: femAB family protein [uncultured bacterium]KKQ10008.1 MAG: FemAB family protein [Candidatus Daviesbacteria bacterium GW2011_GWB1_36_5]KKQ14707.1 MAG: FemAB family protein [Candidatus Daviesbacteria bacterium GW2011_GWA1_36_8]